MQKSLSFRSLRLTAVCFLFLAASAKAAIIVHSFGPGGTGDPQMITPLNTVIGANTSVEPDYRALTSSNTEFQFVRHIFSELDDICFYWFRADGDPSSISQTERWSDVYWYVGDVGPDPCQFVDGAEDGSNNFVLLYSSSVQGIVGVLQYELNGANDTSYPALLLAYAVNPEGLTFEEGVAAIQAIPEPSTVALFSLALLAGFLKFRRRI